MQAHSFCVQANGVWHSANGHDEFVSINALGFALGVGVGNFDAFFAILNIADFDTEFNFQTLFVKRFFGFLGNLLVDEAQEMSPAALCELRLMASARFDSQPLLCVVLAGDARLIDKLRREELIPLGSRIRTRLATEHASRDELLAGLNHLLAGAGNASLMTTALRQTLCDHAAGNYRILTTMAAELLVVAAQRELPQLDEKLYLEVFAQPDTPVPRRTPARR